VGLIPGYRTNIRLEIGDPDQILVWSAHPAFVGLLDIESGRIDSSVVIKHPWGDHWAGPVVPMENGGYAIAPLGDRTPPRRQPGKWIPAPLVHVVDRHGQSNVGIDSVPWLNGVYLSSLQSALTIARFGDTLKVLTHANAQVRSYLIDNARSAVRLLSTIQLDRYFLAPEPKEAVWTYPWIQLNGDKVVFRNVMHVEAASFGADGRLYAIRNYGATWRTFTNSFHGKTGNWRVDAQALEVYDQQGRTLGAYNIPNVSIRWLRADRSGRIFLGDSLPRVFVSADPTSTQHIAAVGRYRRGFL